MNNEVSTYNVPKELASKIKSLIEMTKEVKQYEAEVKKELTEAMKAHDITSISNDLFVATIANRVTISGDAAVVDKEYIKIVESVDSERAKKYLDLYGTLPTGFTSKNTEYLTWRAK